MKAWQCRKTTNPHILFFFSSQVDIPHCYQAVHFIFLIIMLELTHLLLKILPKNAQFLIGRPVFRLKRNKNAKKAVYKLRNSRPSVSDAK